ncbi:TRAFs-binding domain-containing protein [Ideonella sp. DXS22W]|uniref:TRAFs-binding domain-containing protein n=1 Tax=Pseudaquabacterium inlustre TaxID=2984192 RepID=A0ABU9CM27_9BURK
MAKTSVRPAARPSRRATATATTTAPTPGAPRQLTCFVVTGFGNKTDHATGRVLNLDKTFEQLVQPACDAVEVNCFRAIDANLTGSIDSIMYRWIYHADIVIADLSTLNANVFYELGVRHAQRPNTTVIIAESVLVQRIPFDLSTFVVHKYEHGGEAIAEAEQQRFVAHLSTVLRKLIDIEGRRMRAAEPLAAETDSPVFKSLSGMTPPSYVAQSYIEPPPWVPPAQRQRQGTPPGESLASLIDSAEAAKKRKDFAEAIRVFGLAIERQTGGQPGRKPDVFLAQRLALVTYKHGERPAADGRLDVQVAMAALIEAEQILQRYCEPRISNDPETLGLSGAIQKRLFDLSQDRSYLDQAIRFYERGFYVKRDYYNGINVAFMYTLRANLMEDRFQAIVNYGHANMIRQQVAEICEALIADEAAFARRGDQEWVYLSLAEAYRGLGRHADEARLQPWIQQVASDFAKGAYQDQLRKLDPAMQAFQQRVRPDELGLPPRPSAAPASPPASASAPAPTATGATVVRPAGSALPVTIDAGVEPGRSVASIEITCRITYQ